jgi:hypothetical protein
LLYLEPGVFADTLLFKTGWPYSAFMAGLDHVFAGTRLLGLSLSTSALWLPILLAFVIWACVFSVLAWLTHRLLTHEVRNAA